MLAHGPTTPDAVLSSDDERAAVGRVAICPTCLEGRSYAPFAMKASASRRHALRYVLDGSTPKARYARKSPMGCCGEPEQAGCSPSGAPGSALEVATGPLFLLQRASVAPVAAPGGIKRTPAPLPRVTRCNAVQIRCGSCCWNRNNFSGNDSPTAKRVATTLPRIHDGRGCRLRDDRSAGHGRRRWHRCCWPAR